ASFRAACEEAGEAVLADLIEGLASELGAGPHRDYGEFLGALEKAAAGAGVKLSAKRQRLIQAALASRDKAAQPVIKKVHKPGKASPEPLHGLFEATLAGKTAAVEYEPDSELRDTEQVPLNEKGVIEAFIRREVLPHVPDAWVDADSARIGYEISFTRY